MRLRDAAGGAAMLLAVALPALAQATSGDDIDGEHGVLHVHGALTAGACRLEMASAWQTVDAGTVTTGQLRHPGDTGRSVPVLFRLADCLPGPTGARDSRNGNITWSRDAPALAGVRGAGGFGLRLTDMQGRTVPLNEPGVPLLLAPGQNSLEYRLTPVRTAAPLRPGAWQALINVGFSYD